ncbi:unnamed protein product [Rotaria magnacalcarata]|uniref:Uncharacterized protein n=3 Tax=Rotaria TaxID=231623 RepID=A0A816A4X9_9BILA|nr:unnamed protein product [Rotaria magnacalcarata]CAF1590508.1 unnamed protein product [Rotaria magnacalcarata]CAF2032436.1 unnamed protein product [Rotaria magnacalcarata]CAF3426263.1 unnamed protein product [Rotaria socialis]CAF4760532.1 unnamed protein product [Rotaria socialis]
MVLDNHQTSNTHIETVSQPVEWQELIEAAANRELIPPWRRSSSVKERYIRHTTEVLSEYASVNDYVRIHMLHYASEFDETMGKQVAVASPSSIKDPLLIFNEFPYHLSTDIEHWLVWFDGQPTDPEKLVQEVVDRQFIPNERYDIIVYVNPQQFQSVNGIFHAHVFVREKNKVCSV